MNRLISHRLGAPLGLSRRQLDVNLCIPSASEMASRTTDIERIRIRVVFVEPAREQTNVQRDESRPPCLSDDIAIPQMLPYLVTWSHVSEPLPFDPNAFPLAAFSPDRPVLLGNPTGLVIPHGSGNHVPTIFNLVTRLGTNPQAGGTTRREKIPELLWRTPDRYRTPCRLTIGIRRKVITSIFTSARTCLLPSCWLGYGVSSRTPLMRLRRIRLRMWITYSY